MKKTFLPFLIAIAVFFFPVSSLLAHCEIPCGIYDDEMRIEMIIEHVSTVEKSMKQIQKIEKEAKHNSNQLIRWVMNKERHANEIQEIVTQYFMTQRIKTNTKNYEKKLGLLHEMLIFSMKCKQTTDLDHVQKLRSLTASFKELYFEAK